MIFQFTICIVVNIIFNIVIREKPDTPPSAVSEVVYEQLTCKLVLKILRENFNFLALCIAYALLAGSFLAIGSLISNMFTPYGWLPSKIAFASVGILCCGVSGALLIGVFLDRTRLYKFSTLGVLTTIALCTGGLISSLKWFPETSWMHVVCLLLMAFFGTAFYPLCISYGGELTFPIQPSLVNGTFTLFDGSIAMVLALVGAFIVKE